MDIEFLNDLKKDKKLQIFMGAGVAVVFGIVIFKMFNKGGGGGTADNSTAYYTKSSGQGSGNSAEFAYLRSEIEDEKKATSDRFKKEHQYTDSVGATLFSLRNADNKNYMDKFGEHDIRFANNEKEVANNKAYMIGQTQRLDKMEDRNETFYRNTNNSFAKLFDLNTETNKSIVELNNRPVYIQYQEPKKKDISVGVLPSMTGNNGVGFDRKIWVDEMVRNFATEESKSGLLNNATRILDNRKALGMDTKNQVKEIELYNNIPIGATASDIEQVRQNLGY